MAKCPKMFRERPLAYALWLQYQADVAEVFQVAILAARDYGDVMAGWHMDTFIVPGKPEEPASGILGAILMMSRALLAVEEGWSCFTAGDEQHWPVPWWGKSASRLNTEYYLKMLAYARNRAKETAREVSEAARRLSDNCDCQDCQRRRQERRPVGKGRRRGNK